MAADVVSMGETDENQVGQLVSSLARLSLLGAQIEKADGKEAAAMAGGWW